ncbi:unnamed protein product [Rotaria magnacalcarata]|uniref:Uncharacterized protein n=2 Tax=Rotaria magnacalcarata TaxID=392030 RepID=A0A816XW23_9BILA|nr:unnamed protein product [Rotaria magnacalcarata]CAF1408894.1 unnamed protein product [Rotaria magnacalcarata]CAF1977084.1 unnamed protein product [Rotaria magnacalcarata]CAF2150490.1 unnamed protein product [Rotaria magnacalcarata]CAF2152851.1 unnamed protein product [Rotaria magnacalcarata]
MSFKHQRRINSTTSSNTTPSLLPDDETMDPSNLLYNDRQNYQIIFSNDSRFFDTSLHLFKSYCDLGYIKVDKKKSKKNPPSSSSSNTLRPPSSGLNSRWRPRTTGFSSDFDAQRNSNGLSNKLSFLRNRDHSSSQRSDPGPSKLKSTRMKRDSSPLAISYQDKTMVSAHPITDSDSSDEPDIIVTRL